jgi:NTP pyrophosphatase (non-canonical NTP hydrolase)
MNDELLAKLPPLPATATLRQWQEYVAGTVAARGWDRASELEIFLLFSEEVGEFAKAFRRFRRLFAERITEDRAADFESIDVQPARQEMAEELADVLSYLLDLAGRLEIDLEQAFVEKEKSNRRRDWEVMG